MLLKEVFYILVLHDKYFLKVLWRCDEMGGVYVVQMWGLPFHCWKTRDKNNNKIKTIKNKRNLRVSIEWSKFLFLC